MKYYITWSFGDTPTDWYDFAYQIIYGYPVAECMRAIQALYFADYPYDEYIPQFQRLYRLGWEDIPEEWFHYVYVLEDKPGGGEWWQYHYYYWTKTDGLDYYLVSYREIDYMQNYIEDFANSRRFIYLGWYRNGGPTFYYFMDSIQDITDVDTDIYDDIDLHTFWSLEDLLNYALGYGNWISGNFYIYDRGIEQIRKCLESIGGFRMSFEYDTNKQYDYEGEGEFYYFKTYGWYYGNYDWDNNAFFNYFDYLGQGQSDNDMSIFIHYGDIADGNTYWYSYTDLANLVGYYGIGDDSDLANYWYNFTDYADLVGYGTFGSDSNAFWSMYNYSDSADVNTPFSWTDASSSAWDLT